MRNPEEIKIQLQNKSTKKNLCEGHYVSDCTLSFLCHFLLLLNISFHLLNWCTCWMTPIKIHNTAISGRYSVWWYHEWTVRNMKLLQFNTRSLASLRTWHYSRLCFSFSCSGYGFTLIKKRRIKLLFVFTKVLVKKTLQTRCW